MNLKLGIETGYLVADDIYIILKMNGIILQDPGDFSTFGIGFKYSF